MTIPFGFETSLCKTVTLSVSGKTLRDDHDYCYWGLSNSEPCDCCSKVVCNTCDHCSQLVFTMLSSKFNFAAEIVHSTLVDCWCCIRLIAQTLVWVQHT